MAHNETTIEQCCEVLAFFASTASCIKESSIHEKRARCAGPAWQTGGAAPRAAADQDPPGFTEVKRASGRSSARCRVVTPFFIAQGRS